MGLIGVFACFMQGLNVLKFNGLKYIHTAAVTLLHAEIKLNMHYWKAWKSAPIVHTCEWAISID